MGGGGGNGSDLLRYGEGNDEKNEKPIAVSSDVENVDEDGNEVFLLKRKLEKREN